VPLLADIHSFDHGVAWSPARSIECRKATGPAMRARKAMRRKEMSYPYMHTALARERQDTMLAEAQAVRQARAARAHRRGHADAAGRGVRFRRASGWLPSAWSRLLTSRPDSA
jgi:hypothetical protein